MSDKTKSKQFSIIFNSVQSVTMSNIAWLHCTSGSGLTQYGMYNVQCYCNIHFTYLHVVTPKTVDPLLISWSIPLHQRKLYNKASKYIISYWCVPISWLVCVMDKYHFKLVLSASVLQRPIPAVQQCFFFGLFVIGGAVMVGLEFSSS